MRSKKSDIEFAFAEKIAYNRYTRQEYIIKGV